MVPLLVYTSLITSYSSSKHLIKDCHRAASTVLSFQRLQYHYLHIGFVDTGFIDFSLNFIKDWYEFIMHKLMMTVYVLIIIHPSSCMTTRSRPSDTTSSHYYTHFPPKYLHINSGSQNSTLSIILNSSWAAGQLGSWAAGLVENLVGVALRSGCGVFTSKIGLYY